MLASTDPVSSLLQMLTTSPYHRILVSNKDVYRIHDEDDADVRKEGGTSLTGSTQTVDKEPHSGSSIVMLTQVRRPREK
jgi:hypothetical protein